jgi:DNA-binding protein
MALNFENTENKIETTPKPAVKPKPSSFPKPAQPTKKPKAPNNPSKPARSRPKDFSSNNNIIFVGSKPLVNYVKSIAIQFRKNPQEVVIRSRGKFISKAVDIAEVARRNHPENAIKIKEIKINSESFEKEGRQINVSTMDITLSK